MTLKEGGLRGSLRNVGVGVTNIPDSAIAQWKMDEGSGSTLQDSVGDNTGSINGASWVANSQRVGGWWLDFDGNDDTVSFNEVNRITDGGDFSIAITVEPEEINTDGNVLSHSFEVDGDDVRFAIGPRENDEIAVRYDNQADGIDITGAAPNTTVNETIRFGVSVDTAAEEISIYVDGDDVTAPETDTPVIASGGAFLLGARSDDAFHLDMLADNAIIFDEALDEIEFQNDFDRQPWS